MTTLTTERIFTSGDLPRLSLPRTDGLITCRWPTEPSLAADEYPADGCPGDVFGERRGAQVGFVMVEPMWLVRAASERVREGEADAVVIHFEGGPPGRTALALTFATHLRANLAGARKDSHVVTAGSRPDLTGLKDLVRIPHLVTISDATGAITDTVVWEVMTTDQFDAWLDGAPRPDQRAIEAHLPGLLRLRGLLRLGRLDQRYAGPLLDMLAGGTLSARLVYRFPRLVLPLAATAAA